MSNKNLTIILLLLISICGVSIYIYNSSSSTNSVIPVKTGIRTLASPPLDSRFHGNDNDELMMTNQSTTNIEPISQTDNLTVQQFNSLISSEESTHVKMIVSDKTYEAAIIENSTIYDLMKKLSQTDKLQFSSREYSGLGQFVEEINGVKENKRQGIYWLLYINGQSANIGISNYIIKPNDLISWKYDKAQF